MNDYLPGEVKHGTHVAYLVKHDDNDIKDPLARIAIKQYSDHPTDALFYPENKVYGDAPASFMKTVKHWSKTNYPMKMGVIYRKIPAVYNDDGNRSMYLHTENDIDSILNNNPTPNVKSLGTKPIPEELHNTLVNKILDDPSGKKLDRLYFHSDTLANMSSTHINQLYNAAKTYPTKEGIRRITNAGGHKLSKENVEHFLNNDDIKNTNTANILGNPHLPQHIIDNMDVFKYKYLHPMNITKEMTHKFIDENIKHITDFDDYDTLSNFTRHIKNDDELKSKIITASSNPDNSNFNRKPLYRLLNKINLKDHHIDAAYEGANAQAAGDSFLGNMNGLKPHHIKDIYDADSFMSNHSRSPEMMAKVMSLMFNPDNARHAKYVYQEHRHKFPAEHQDHLKDLYGN
jgi:hypothetical protein